MLYINTIVATCMVVDNFSYLRIQMYDTIIITTFQELVPAVEMDDHLKNHCSKRLVGYIITRTMNQPSFGVGYPDSINVLN